MLENGQETCLVFPGTEQGPDPQRSPVWGRLQIPLNLELTLGHKGLLHELGGSPCVRRRAPCLAAGPHADPHGSEGRGRVGGCGENVSRGRPGCPPRSVPRTMTQGRGREQFSEARHTRAAQPIGLQGAPPPQSA